MSEIVRHSAPSPRPVRGRRARIAVAALAGVLAVALSACGGRSQVRSDVAAPAAVPANEAARKAAAARLVRKPASDTAAIRARLAELQKVTLPADVIQPGDVFDYQVYGEDDISARGLTVRPDGRLALPLAGDMVVGGRTIEDVLTEVHARLGRYIRNPQAALIQTRYAGRTFTIVGKVVTPGAYTVDRPLKVLDAFGLARGLSTGIINNNSVDLADLHNAYLVRDTVVLPVDFAALVRGGDMLHNIPLLPGDYIHVPSAEAQEVYVMGEVNRQMATGWRPGITVGQVMGIAGGAMHTARTAQIQVIRGSLHDPELYDVDLAGILAGTAADFTLEAADIVYVPPSGLARWNYALSAILPTLQALQSGFLLQQVLAP